jgi:hypothetical protein
MDGIWMLKGARQALLSQMSKELMFRKGLARQCQLGLGAGRLALLTCDC